jgi:hypothetical protein
VLGISLLDKRKSNTLSLWNGDSGSLTITNNNDVGKSGGEGLSLGILHMGDLERSWMLLERLEVSNSTNVVSSDEHDGGSWLELNNSTDGSGGEIKLD